MSCTHRVLSPVSNYVARRRYIYVDDLVLYRPLGDMMDMCITILSAEFEMEYLGTVKWLLGIHIEINKQGISLSQQKYVDDILRRFHMEECNSVTTPADHNVKLSEQGDEPPADLTLYLQLIGSLMYLVTYTRPDLAFIVTRLSQFNKCPSTLHMAQAKRVLRYLKGTRDKKLLYPFQQTFSLLAYSDSDYAGCSDTRKSTSGYIMQFGESTISWRSKKQGIVTLSTCEAEYVALSVCARELLWLQKALDELLTEFIPMLTYCDNRGTIDNASNQKINEKSKHIDMIYHFMQEKIEDGTITLLHVPSVNNLADICTKGLAKPLFETHCDSLFHGR